jgi:MFS family permease
LTFGLYWGSGIALVAACVPPPLRATGQSLFVIAMLGFGNVVGYIATGWLYDTVGSVSPAFLAAAALELVPLGLVLARQPARGAPPAVTASR